MWTFIGPRNIPGRVKALAVHPANDNVVYAAGETGGIWKSVNGGHSWRPLMHHEESLVVGSFALTLDPMNPAQTIIYAGTGVHVRRDQHMFTGVGLYVSTNDGAIWTLKSMPITAVTKVVVSPSEPRHLCVGGREGLVRSRDGGDHWDPPLLTGVITDACWDPGDARVLYVCVDGVGLRKITFNGAAAPTIDSIDPGIADTDFRWIKMTIGHRGVHGSGFLLLKDTQGNIHRGIFSVTDGRGAWAWDTRLGAHGRSGTAPAPGIHSTIAVSPEDENFIVVGGENGDFTEDAMTWPGMSGGDYHAIAFAPSNPSLVYAGCDFGVFKHTRATTWWSRVNNGLAISQFYDCGFWPPLSSVVGGGCQDSGIHLSTGGLTWTNVHAEDCGPFLIDPDDPRTQYGVAYSDVIKTGDGWASSAVRTQGLGTYWSATHPWLPLVVMDPTHHRKVFTGTNRVYYSLDAAETDWIPCSQVFGDQYVRVIAVARSNANRVYAGIGGYGPFAADVPGKVYRSTNGGSLAGGSVVDWQDISSTAFGNSAVRSIAVDHRNPDRVVVGLGHDSMRPGGGVFLTENAGETDPRRVVWRDITSNLQRRSAGLPIRIVTAVALDQNASNTIYAGTTTGVFITTNAGMAWSAFSDGLPNVIISTLALDVDGNVLYAATYGRGMYKTSLDPAHRVPRADVYLRDSILDTGERFPSPSDVPNPLDVCDQVFAWQSPDIKVDAYPFQGSIPSPLDGVEFDELVTHESLVRGEINRFYLQVHNRGPETATGVKVRAFHCNATMAVPPLPHPLQAANDFALTDETNWKPVGPAIAVGTVEPNVPVIVSWNNHDVDRTWTEHSCIIAVVSSSEDPYPFIADTDVNTIVRQYKYICQKNVNVISYGGAEPVRTCMMRLMISNTGQQDGTVDVIVRPDTTNQMSVALLLEPVKFAAARNALKGVTVVRPKKGRKLGEWYRPPGVERGKRVAHHWGKVLRTKLYRFRKTRPSRLAGIKMKSGQRIQAVILLTDLATPEAPATQRFSILQRQRGKIVGGSTYEIRRVDSKPAAGKEGEAPRLHSERRRSDPDVQGRAPGGPRWPAT